MGTGRVQVFPAKTHRTDLALASGRIPHRMWRGTGRRVDPRVAASGTGMGSCAAACGSQFLIPLVLFLHRTTLFSRAPLRCARAPWLQDRAPRPVAPPKANNVIPRPCANPPPPPHPGTPKPTPMVKSGCFARHPKHCPPTNVQSLLSQTDTVSDPQRHARSRRPWRWRTNCRGLCLAGVRRRLGSRVWRRLAKWKARVWRRAVCRTLGPSLARKACFVPHAHAPRCARGAAMGFPWNTVHPALPLVWPSRKGRVPRGSPQQRGAPRNPPGRVGAVCAVSLPLFRRRPFGGVQRKQKRADPGGQVRCGCCPGIRVTVDP